MRMITSLGSMALSGVLLLATQKVAGDQAQGFETASITRNTVGTIERGSIRFQPKGRLAGTNVTLEDMIKFAYQPPRQKQNPLRGFVDVSTRGVRPPTSSPSSSCGSVPSNARCSVWEVSYRDFRAMGLPGGASGPLEVWLRGCSWLLVRIQPEEPIFQEVTAFYVTVQFGLSEQCFDEASANVDAHWMTTPELLKQLDL